MKRDMELIRKILFYIEEKHEDVALPNIKIEGYEQKTVAYHCDLLYQAKLVSDYHCQFGDNTIYFFSVGGLTWDGQNYLEIFRDEKIWEKTTNEVEVKKLPKTIEFFAKVAGVFTGAALNEMKE